METANQQMNGEVKTAQAIEMPDPRDEYITRANGEIESCHAQIATCNLQIAKGDKKIELMRKELAQYHQDLVFWQKAHGSEYPVRRIAELEKKLQEIDQV